MLSVITYHMEDSIRIRETKEIKNLNKETQGPLYRLFTDIDASALSMEIDCREYNCLIVYITISKQATWQLDFLGAYLSGGNFVPRCDDKGRESPLYVDLSGWFLIKVIPDYVKFRAIELYEGSTFSMSVRPVLRYFV